jgi:sucrose-6-phosphate hydrolase SacC (GH32 family)
MSNWSYAQQVPTAPWRSAMTLPRALTLRPTPDGLRLVQTPVREVTALAQTTRRFAGGSMDDAMAWLSAQGDLPPLLDVEVTLTKVQPSASFIVHIQTGPDGEGPLLTIDAKQRTLTLDRRKAGEATFHATYSTSHQAPLRVVGDTVTLRLVLDRGSMEVFAQRGETVMTDLIFPSTDVRAIHLAPLGEAPRVHSIVLRSLRMRRSTQGS